ncbi:MAG: hypothetical protein AB1298_09195, partial [Bacteroidota bacterium]
MKEANLFFVIFVLAWNGCSENPVTPDIFLDSDFKIQFGKSVFIQRENLYITFTDVVEDSRCPEGLRCFWEGTAKIKLLISKGSENRIDTVQTYLPQKIISIGEVNNSYLFWVKKVEPYPKANAKIEKRYYLVTLNVSRFTYGFSASEIENKTGVFGQAYIGPITPVERNGYINYKPFQTSFKIVDSNNDSTTVQTDSAGRFIFYLQRGEYQIVPDKKFPA